MFPIKYPFGIEKYAATYPKNIITIGGSKVAKNWAEGVTSSPKGKKWTFQLVGGANFVNIQEATE